MSSSGKKCDMTSNLLSEGRRAIILHVHTIVQAWARPEEGAGIVRMACRRQGIDQLLQKTYYKFCSTF